jgi:hypothetical protein
MGTMLGQVSQVGSSPAQSTDFMQMMMAMMMMAGVMGAI